MAKASTRKKSKARVLTGIDPIDIDFHTDRSGLLHIGVRSRPAGKQAAGKKRARA